MKRKVIELEIIDEMEESGVSAISLVDSPAINVEWMAFRKEEFVKPRGDESEDEFVSRCIGVLVGDEGYETDQAAAICYDTWREDKFIEPNPCWEGYEAYGLKEDGTPNCIPVENRKQKLSIDTSNLPPYVEELPKKKNNVKLHEQPTQNSNSYRENEKTGRTKSSPSVSGSAKSARYFSTNPVGSKTRMFLDEDQRIIVGPAMIPGLEIVRQDEDSEEIYYVKFSESTVSKISEKFMRELRNKDTNILHQEDLPADSYVMESWIVETKDDKAITKYGFDVPIGTWMVKMRVTNPKVWKLVKEGKLRGLSIEGSFVDKEEVEDLKRGDILDKIIKILSEE